MSWQMQEAKARLSEVIRRAAKEGPQIVTQHGVETAVVLSIEDYRRLRAAPSFKDYLLLAPKLDDDVIDAINDRSRNPGRPIDL